MNHINSFIRYPTRYVFIAGSSDCSKNNNLPCKFLGYELAKYHIGVLCAGSKPGAFIISSMDKILSELPNYDPTLFITFSRKTINEISAPRIGCRIFIGKTVEEMRNAAFNKTSAMIIVGGNSRTKDEVTCARKSNILIIPVGMSGGMAHFLWHEQILASGNHACYSQLNRKNPHIASEAVVNLLKFHFILRD